MCAGLDGPGGKAITDTWSEEREENYSDGDPYESDKRNWG